MVHNLKYQLCSGNKPFIDQNNFSMTHFVNNKCRVRPCFYCYDLMINLQNYVQLHNKAQHELFRP